MKKLVLMLAVLAMVASPALASLTAETTVRPPAASRDWGGEIKWDQMTPGIDTYGGHSTVDRDTPMTSTTADDFLCTETGPIADIHFAGWSYYGNSYINGFRITFWTDVPEDPGVDESHPGTLLYDYTVTDLLPPDVTPGATGWRDNLDGTFTINLPEDQWFTQEAGNIYWIGIQGDMVDDGYGDTFYWNFVDRTVATWGDDAAFESSYFGFAPWANWGWPDADPTTGAPDIYEGPFPAGWDKSADMAFALSTPEPATLALLGFGALALIRRRR